VAAQLFQHVQLSASDKCDGRPTFRPLPSPSPLVAIIICPSWLMEAKAAKRSSVDFDCKTADPIRAALPAPTAN